MKPRNRLSFAAGVCLLALLATFVTGTVWGSFGATTDSSANSITAASDFVAPTVSRSVISKISFFRWSTSLP